MNDHLDAVIVREQDRSRDPSSAVRGLLDVMLIERAEELGCAALAQVTLAWASLQQYDELPEIQPWSRPGDSVAELLEAATDLAHDGVYSVRAPERGMRLALAHRHLRAALEVQAGSAGGGGRQ